MIYISREYADERTDFICLRELCVLWQLPLGPLILQMHPE